MLQRQTFTCDLELYIPKDLVMSRPVIKSEVAMSTLYLLGFLRDNEIDEDGSVPDISRLRAEHSYARYLEENRENGPHRRPRPHPVQRASSAPIRPEVRNRIDTVSNVQRVRIRRTVDDPERAPQRVPIDTCSVCYSNDKEYACVPCYHLCVCLQCGGRIQQCPICRQTITRLQRIFI